MKWASFALVRLAVLPRLGFTPVDFILLSREQVYEKYKFTIATSRRLRWSAFIIIIVYRNNKKWHKNTHFYAWCVLFIIVTIRSVTISKAVRARQSFCTPVNHRLTIALTRKTYLYSVIGILRYSSDTELETIDKTSRTPWAETVVTSKPLQWMRCIQTHRTCDLFCLFVVIFLSLLTRTFWFISKVDPRSRDRSRLN